MSYEIGNIVNTHGGIGRVIEVEPGFLGWSERYVVRLEDGEEVWRGADELLLVADTRVEKGSRVRRVKGTSIEGLDGTVRYLDTNRHGVLVALVALDYGEPGIGHQLVCPVDHLALLDEEVAS